jgi:hypothetical protein
VNALSKPRSNHLSTTLALQLVQKSKHKRKKEKTPPLEIHDEVQKDFILVCKKCLTKHGGQAIKQVLKLERIFKCTTSLEPITWEKLQHDGIGSHLFYFNLQHCNVSLNFDNIQLTIAKHLQSISPTKNHVSDMFQHYISSMF